MADYTSMSVANGSLNFLQMQPFYPLVKHSPPEEFTVTFNQAYVFDYTDTHGKPEDPIEITGMDQEYTLPSPESGQSKYFYVELIKDSSKGSIYEASFKESSSAPPESTETQKNILVAVFDGIKLDRIYLRDNIHWRNSGGDINHPFKISVDNSEETKTWSVSSFGSSILNGTNGDEILSPSIANLDVDNAFASDTFIVLEADMANAGTEPSNWTISASSNTQEVEFSGDDQVKIRALLGKVAIEDGNAVVKQGVLFAFRMDYGFLNGKLVRILDAAPSSASSL
jgi:hypothetical protein